MLKEEINSEFVKYNIPGVSIAAINGEKKRLNYCIGTLEKNSVERVTDYSIFHACSISKMVTALGVLRLVQDGKLDLDININEYLADWKVEENSYTKICKVNLRNLLAHQAGIVDNEGSYDYYKTDSAYPKMIDILNGKSIYNPKKLCVEYVPESKWKYSDGGYCIIEKIIEDVTGQPFSSVMNRIVFEPLGLKTTFFLSYDELINMCEKYEFAAGHDVNGDVLDGKRVQYPYLAAAGLWTTPSELLKITFDIIEAWNGNTNKLLNPEMAKLMLQPINSKVLNVGLGVFLSKNSKGTSFLSKGWGVGFQCMLKGYPTQKSAIVVMTNSDPDKEQEEALTGNVMDIVSKKFKLT